MAEYYVRSDLKCLWMAFIQVANVNLNYLCNGLIIQKTRTGFLKRICLLQSTQCVMVSVLVQPVSCAHLYFTSSFVTSCFSLVHCAATPTPVITWFNSSGPRLPASTPRVFKSLCSYRHCILLCMTSSFFSPCKLFLGGGGLLHNFIFLSWQQT